MLKLYADTFRLTEEAMTESAIKRLRWLTVISMPFIPMAAIIFMGYIPKSLWILPFLISFLVCSIATITVLLTRIMNSVWALDKYLDEWEKDLKRQSMTAGFMAVVYIVMGLFLVCFFAYDVIAPFVEENTKSFILIMLSLIIAVGFYTQIFKQLSLIKPMEADELETPGYIKTSARNVLGIIALSIVAFITGAGTLGFYSGHRSHNIEHAAAQDVCGDAKVETHKNSDLGIEVTCEGSDAVTVLDAETLKPVQTSLD